MKETERKGLKHWKLFLCLGIVAVIALVNVLIGVFAGWDKAAIPWNFISDQILGMKWLSALLWMLITAIGGAFDESSWQYKVESSVQFLVYDFIKIGILLCLLIFVISYVQSYFPPERTKKILGRFHGIGANVIGALLGTVTPFCSCSSIPIFIGFTRAGLSSGVTFSFLISSPLVDLGSLMWLLDWFWPSSVER